ncbi:TonB-dependent receptor plug domain-containing protein, partial [Autumnicola musiva]
LVYGDGKLNLELRENMEMLGDVLIEANKDENIESAVMGVSSIDPEKIKTIPLVLGERDILKVAATLPGIKTAGEGAMGFNVRGGRTDQNLILLDDAVIYSPSHFLGFFSAINPFTTGNVDIYKGNIPAEFGGRLSSVFDISTRDGNFEEISGEGSIGPVTGNMTVEIPIVKNKASLIAGARATYSDWILRSLSEENLKNSQASFYDGIIKYKHKLNKKDNFQLTLYYSDDKFSITNDSLFNYKNKLGSFKWQHKFDSYHSAEFTLVHSNYKYNIDYDSGNTRNFNFNYNIRESQAKLKFNYNPKALKNHKFKYGISSKVYTIAPGNIRRFDEESLIEPMSIPEEKGLESAVFIADSYEVTNKLLMNIGLRYSFYAALGPSEQNSYQEGTIKSESSIVERLQFGKNETIKTYRGPEIRASLRYLLRPTLSIKGSFNKTIQYIHLLSNNTTVSPTDTYKLSDYNIKPQKGNQYSLGLYKNFENKNLELSVEGYYKTMDNLLDYKVGADLILNENIETELLQGEGKAYGIEFLLRKDTGKLNGYLGYSYSRSFVKLDSPIQQEKVNSGNFFPANHDRPHDVSIVSNYKITNRYSISGNFTYQTGSPVTYPVGRFNYAGEEQVLYSDRNKYRIPDYYRLDLGVNIEGNHKKNKLAHSFWNISVYNVLGRNNPYSIYFVNDNDGDIRSYKTSIFSVPVPTITYNFKF